MPFSNCKESNLKKIKEVERLYNEIKKLSEIIENEVHQNKAEIRDKLFEEYNVLIKELTYEYGGFPLGILTDSHMTKFRTVKNSKLKMAHMMKLSNFKKIQYDLSLPIGSYIIIPKMDGISLVCWNSPTGLMFLTRGDNEFGKNKIDLMEYFLPESVIGAQKYFKENPDHKGIRGELILDSGIKSYSKYMRVYNPEIIEGNVSEPDPDFPESLDTTHPESYKDGHEPITPYSDNISVSTDTSIKIPELSIVPVCQSCMKCEDRKLDNFHTVKMFSIFTIPAWVEVWVPKRSIKKSACVSQICEVPEDFEERIKGKGVKDDSGYSRTKDQEEGSYMIKGYMLYRRNLLSSTNRINVPSHCPGDFKIRFISVQYQVELISIKEDFLPHFKIEINMDSCMRRELISGLANRKEITCHHNVYKNHIHWVCYQVYGSDRVLTESLQQLKNHKIEIAPVFEKNVRKPTTMSTDYVQKFLDKYTDKTFDCDGITVRKNTNDFDKIVGLKKTRFEPAMIKAILWKKQSSGKIIPRCEIEPISHNGRVFKTLNMFSFENLCGEMYQVNDMIEVKFVADSPVIHKNLSLKKKLTNEQFKNLMLSLFVENVWVEGAHLYTTMNKVIWWVKKLNIQNIQGQGLTRFLTAYDIMEYDVQTFVKFIYKASRQIEKIRLKSHVNLIQHIIKAIDDNEEFALSMWALQIPGIQLVTLKDKVNKGIELKLDPVTNKILSHKIVNKEFFESNPTIIKFRDSISEFFSLYNFFFDVKTKIKSD
ncbi:NAD+ dependent DNA ligase [Salmon gill poxvirus]|nr:NAD+ dependent DNA ligase [Salmon gill poxvirus]